MSYIINPLHSQISQLLNKEITLFTLKGKGAVNNAYYIETSDSRKYIVKQERDIKEFEPQNDLFTEAKIIEYLHDKDLGVSIPKVIFKSDSPQMYCYEYIEGEMLINVWPNLSEEEKISICESLGIFHARIGKVIDKTEALALGMKIDESVGLHLEVEKEYLMLLADPEVPEEYKSLAKHTKEIFDTTLDDVIFQCVHNDAHHENILIKENRISGIIDFGNTEYGEVAREFSRYIRDFPDHFEYIISLYEKVSDNMLSRKRVISNAFLSGFAEIVEDYKKGDSNREKAEIMIKKYRELLQF
ncbi:MAG: aph(2)-Ib [Candidatus Taylorbacteria bacterium]|nr:aph(2)-Ib [Candidatus Taylorbacteria bacterium]